MPLQGGRAINPSRKQQSPPESSSLTTAVRHPSPCRSSVGSCERTGRGEKGFSVSSRRSSGNGGAAAV